MYPTADRPVNGTFVRTQVDSLRDSGLAVDVLLIRSAARMPAPLRAVWKYVAGYVRLRRCLRAEEFLVVHAHFAFPGLLAVLQRRVPAVVTFHGDDVLGTVDRSGTGRTTWTSRKVVLPLSRFVARRSLAIVQSEEMQHRLAVDGARVVPCEVDLDLFTPTRLPVARAALGLPPTARLVLFAADPRIPVKNHALAVDVVSRVAERLPDVELVTVHQEPQRRLAMYMSACDALLVTSFQEGSPNVVKQAMACDLPVVSTDVGDVRDLLDGARLSSVSPPDPELLSASLARTLGTPSRSDGRARISWLDRGWVTEHLLQAYADASSAQSRAPLLTRRSGLSSPRAPREARFRSRSSATRS